MFGQSDRIAWLCMANTSNDNLIILGIAGLHWVVGLSVGFVGLVDFSIRMELVG